MTLTFDSLEELMGFVKKVTGNADADRPAAAPVTAPAPAAQQSLPPQVQQPVLTAPVTQPQPAPTISVPTTAPSYTLDDLTKAAIPLMDSGKQPELLQLIESFGVEAMPSLRPDQYGAFATALRGLGARI